MRQIRLLTGAEGRVMHRASMYMNPSLLIDADDTVYSAMPSEHKSLAKKAGHVVLLWYVCVFMPISVLTLAATSRCHTVRVVSGSVSDDVSCCERGVWWATTGACMRERLLVILVYDHRV